MQDMLPLFQSGMVGRSSTPIITDLGSSKKGSWRPYLIFGAIVALALYSFVVASLFSILSARCRFASDLTADADHDISLRGGPLGGTTTDDDGDDVTLVTHGTVDRFDTFAKMVSRWQGPITASFYLRDAGRDHEIIMNGTEQLRRINPNIQLAFYTTTNEAYRGFYPVNLMRNLAIRLARTEFFFLIDMDLVPDEGLYSFLKDNMKHMSKNARSEVYVVPLFQLERRGKKGQQQQQQQQQQHYDIPRNRMELREAIEEHEIKQGYKNEKHVGHSPTDYERWWAAGDDPSTGKVGGWYEVEYVNRYEPYVVGSKRYMPAYDERFEFYSHDKTSYTYLLHKRGFKFMVLLQHFVVHVDHEKADWASAVDHKRANALYADVKKNARSS